MSSNNYEKLGVFYLGKKYDISNKKTSSDELVEKLRKKYAPKLSGIQDKINRARQKMSLENDQDNKMCKLPFQLAQVC